MLFAFERWDEILKLPAPDASLMITNAVWHFACGSAYAAKRNVAETEREQTLFREHLAKIPADTNFDMLNKTANVLKIPDNLLAGAIARAKEDDKGAVEFLTQAIASEDALNYSEPPSWYPPVRPTLGRVLLAANQAAKAEKFFRADLEKNPRDARALAGLRDALKMEGREYESQQINRQYRAAWNVARRARPSGSR